MKKTTKQKLLPALAKEVKQYKKDVFLTWAIVFAESALEILIAFFIQFLMNAINAQSTSGIVMWSLIMAAMAILAAFCGIMAGYYASSASAGFGKNLREEMFIKIQSYSFKNIDKFSPASIVTRTTTDVTNVQFSFMMIIRTVVRAPFMMIFALIMCFIMAPKLAWIFLIIIPVLLFILLLIASQAHKLFVKIFNTYDELNESVEEDVDGIRVVKSFDRK